MIAGNMQHIIDNKRHVLRHGNEDYADQPAFFVDSLDVELEADMDLADLEAAWLSLKKHFEAASRLKKTFH